MTGVRPAAPGLPDGHRGANPSIAPYLPEPPRPLTEEERTTLLALADALILPADGVPRPSEAPDAARWLERALAARRDIFTVVLDAAASLGAATDRRAALRDAAQDPHSGFAELAEVLTGFHLLNPAVRRAIAYPGQVARPAPFDEAVAQLTDGILDPVLERGPIFRVPPSREAP